MCALKTQLRGVGRRGFLRTAKCMGKEIVDSSWCNIMFAVAFGNWIYILITREGIVNDFGMCLFYLTLIDSSHYVIKWFWEARWNFHGSWKKNNVRLDSSAFRDVHCKQKPSTGKSQGLAFVCPQSLQCLISHQIIEIISRSEEEMFWVFDIVFHKCLQQICITIIFYFPSFIRMVMFRVSTNVS